MADQIITPQSVFPPYWKGVYAISDGDLAFYGSGLLRILIQCWRSAERHQVEEVKRLQRSLNVVEGQSVVTLKQLAERYDNPELPPVTYSEDGWGKYPGPSDDESKQRKAGTTTLNLCGWCKYSDGALKQRNFNVAPTCSLIPSELGDGGGYGGTERFYFNTPCALTNGSDALVRTSAKYVAVELETAKALKEVAAQKIRYLRRIIKMAEEKPLLSAARPPDWFGEGDEVVCFIHDAGPEGVRCVTGRVVKGGRHDRVLVVANGPVYEDIDVSRGRGLSYQLREPDILHQWEHEYLKTHPEFLEVWLRAATAGMRRHFNPEAFAQAI